MVHIVLFNTEYQRQFELVLSRKKWNGLVAEYGTVDAVVVAFLTSAQVQLADVRRASSFRQFIRYTAETGEFVIAVKTKRTDPLGKGEYKIGNRADRRTKKDMARMNLVGMSKRAERGASADYWKTIPELKEKYGKDYSKRKVTKRERDRW